MASRSSSVKARRMLKSWHTLALLFFCIIGCASAEPGLRLGAVSNSKIDSSLGRELQKEDEKDQKNKEKENEKGAEAPTAAPFSIIEFQLASFTLSIDGPLSDDGETEIREELQRYLLDYFLDKQEEKVGIDTDSIVLSMNQIVESYVANEVPGVRSLQSDSSAAISTLVEYETSANLRFKEDENEDVIVDLYTDVLEIYVKALEDRTNLQGHFLDLFSSELEDPVVFTEVQVGERPPVPFNSEEALKEIQSILDPPASIIDTVDENGANSNASVSDGNSNNAPKGRVAIYVCFALLGLLIGLCVIVFFRRKEKKLRNEKPDTLSLEYIENDEQATDDVNVSEENNNYDKIMNMTEANTVSTGKDISYHSGKEDDDSEAPPPPNTENNPPTTEERSSKKKSFMSFLPFKGNKQGDESSDHDDDLTLDSFGLKLKSFNNVSYNDDDSMMGYSLTSMNRANQEAQQDESLLQDESTLVDGETLSYASSVSDSAYNDQVFEGVQKILKDKRKENYENSTLGGESLSRVDTFETEDGEDASAYKDDESNNEDDQSVASAVRSVVSALSAAASKYFGEDELMMIEKERSSAPSEEFRSPAPILRTESVESDPDIPLIPNTRSDPDIPIIQNIEPDPDIPIIPNTRSDRDTPIIQKIEPDPDIPMIPNTRSDPDMPIIPDNQPDPDIPMIPNTRSDRDTPIIQNVSPDPNIPMIPDDRPDPDMPMIPDTRPDPDIPMILNTRSDRDTPIIQNTRSGPDIPMISNTYVIDDVASDAPSDERMGPSPVKRPDATPHPEAMTNSMLIDNDPAVVNYLVQGPESTRNESMESEDQEPNVSMEL